MPKALTACWRLAHACGKIHGNLSFPAESYARAPLLCHFLYRWQTFLCDGLEDGDLDPAPIDLTGSDEEEAPPGPTTAVGGIPLSKRRGTVTPPHARQARAVQTGDIADKIEASFMHQLSVAAHRDAPAASQDPR